MDEEEEWTEHMIANGYQKYRYQYLDDYLPRIIVSITCLTCNTISETAYDIDNQYCAFCKKYHITPN